MDRFDGRAADAIRPVQVVRGFVDGRPNSVLYSSGQTRVICVASMADDTPPWLNDGTGWLTAEYSLLPYSTRPRIQRSRNKPDGRTTEIQRLIGRSLRASLDLSAIPGRSIQVDCDVLLADGGTRTAAICGASIALDGLIGDALSAGFLKKDPRIASLRAISCGIVAGELRLDLDYEEDVRAELDLNIVGTEGGSLVEVQGTSESQPVDRERWSELLELGFDGLLQVASAIESS